MDRSVADLGAAGISTGDRPALGGDGMVHGVEQIGRGTVVGLEAKANAKDAHRRNAPEGAVRRGRDPDTSLFLILSNESPSAPPRKRQWLERKSTHCVDNYP